MLYSTSCLTRGSNDDPNASDVAQMNDKCNSSENMEVVTERLRAVLQEQSTETASPSLCINASLGDKVCFFS